MRILISGICGFVGSKLAQFLCTQEKVEKVIGVDSLARHGSWVNMESLRKLGIEVFHGDVRSTGDLDSLPAVDWVIDAAASPSVLAGVNAGTTSRQLVDTNLGGTVNLLEYCKKHQAGFVLLSTSRVYSIPELAAIPLKTHDRAFAIESSGKLPTGLLETGVGETFSTGSPISLYGATKLASELLAREYSFAFGIPIWINRCGVLAGAGQFGKPDQGIFAFWLHSWRERAPLRYIGFDGSGHQVRDCLHPRDLAALVAMQMTSTTGRDRPTTVNVSGGIASCLSLAQLSDWCTERWGVHEVQRDRDPRPYDLPWLALDHTLATQEWGWQPKISAIEILEEIADHADANPHWLQMSS